MKKGIIFILLMTFLVFLSASTVFAAFPFDRFFGGKIKYEVSLKIDEKESEGYICQLNGGTSITITPMGSPLLTPTEYFIPLLIRSRTGTIPTRGQLILGRYTLPTLITCTQPVTGATTTVSLDTINLFGTSRF